jgi:hypothetical protein
MQARVEPELLFGALDDVQRLYRFNVAAADALLDDLIVYLRAALPHMRGAASTVRLEASLAGAYLKVMPAGRDARQIARVDIAAELHDTPFPPMVLLSLAHAVAAAGAATVVTIDARVLAQAEPGKEHGRIVLSVGVPTIPDGWTEPRVESVRSTLLHYFGNEAELRVGTIGGNAHAVITGPL